MFGLVDEIFAIGKCENWSFLRGPEDGENLALYNSKIYNQFKGALVSISWAGSIAFACRGGMGIALSMLIFWEPFVPFAAAIYELDYSFTKKSFKLRQLWWIPPCLLQVKGSQLRCLPRKRLWNWLRRGCRKIFFYLCYKFLLELYIIFSLF